MIRSYYLAADSQQYGAWNRTRRLRATPYLARTDTNTSRRATALATGTENQPSTTTGVEAVSTEPQTEKRPETLFGPNIGIVSDGPAWAQSEDAKKGTPSDYLTPEIVRRWVETSKDTIQPTTTLQALVNLKRPTLKLSPVTLQPSEDPSEDPANTESHNNHALEFEYDCDAPKCSITVQVIVSNHSSPSENLDRITVYEAVTEGGFGRLLTLEDGATIELGRFEYMGQGSPAVDADKIPKANKTVVTTEVSEVSEGPAQTIVTPAPVPTFENQENARKRRFVALHFRRRVQNQSVSGPALAVLDNDAAAATEEGVRIAIRLVALDELGKELSSVNRQMTYLHVIRFGPPVTDGEDNRPWVVKVVKREATIGSHTFHLHEIYGLSSTSTSAQPTTSPDDATPIVAHTYPPTVPVPPAEDEPSSECLVCLSSPREVVLLPCRHLVACKECAINMVEFGAGGAITHAEEPATTAEAQPAEAADTPPTVDDSAPPASTGEEASACRGQFSGIFFFTAATNDLRHVCAGHPKYTPHCTGSAEPTAQTACKGLVLSSYTSLLRITTTPPTMEDTKEGKRVSTSTMDHPLANTAPADQAAAMAPEPVPEEAAPTPSRSLRPVFLQRLQRRTTDASSPV
ncbi:hypothetical protein EDB83DRAFT_2355083 [Lactarius deliciosus]|nr:hypothetical protein EDB83DRAFT_2355083 [Lactarius deliciosus]